MNKYNIKVGDYVETVEGKTGYVQRIYDDGFEWKDPQYLHFAPFNEEIISGKNFVRIGAIDFNKNKNDFKPIKYFNDLEVVDFYDKLNELIDHINAIQERLNEYDSTRTD